MRTAITTLLILACSVLPSLGGSNPSITAQVDVIDGVKTYTYSIVNDVDSQEVIRSFTLFMPEAGALAVTSFTCSRRNWFAHSSIRGDSSKWMIMEGGEQENGILPTEEATFKLTTSADVPTSYTFKPSAFPGNWDWGPSFGEQLLPVPVPEPGGAQAIMGGLVGLGGLMLRQRTDRS
ncbi:MAG: hypothetical protein ACYC0V_20990 [Armatimonadota bacterium]